MKNLDFQGCVSINAELKTVGRYNGVGDSSNLDSMIRDIYHL